MNFYQLTTAHPIPKDREIDDISKMYIHMLLLIHLEGYKLRVLFPEHNTLEEYLRDESLSEERRLDYEQRGQLVIRKIVNVTNIIEFLIKESKKSVYYYLFHIPELFLPPGDIELFKQQKIIRGTPESIDIRLYDWKMIHREPAGILSTDLNNSYNFINIIRRYLIYDIDQQMRSIVRSIIKYKERTLEDINEVQDFHFYQRSPFYETLFNSLDYYLRYDDPFGMFKGITTEVKQMINYKFPAVDLDTTIDSLPDNYVLINSTDLLFDHFRPDHDSVMH